MKNTRTVSCIAVAYVIVFAGFVIAPRFGLMHIDAVYNFSFGGLVVGLAVTLAELGDRIRVNRRLTRMTAPLAELVRKDFESVGRSAESAEDVGGGYRPLAQAIREALTLMRSGAVG